MGLPVLVCLVLVVYVLICVSAKECTNSPSHTYSHTIRAQMASSDTGTWKEGIISHYHLTPTDESTWMDLRRKLTNEEAQVEDFHWAMLYRAIKGLDGVHAQMQGANFLKEVSLHDVRLDPDTIYGRAQQTNLEYLLMLDADRLVWSFRKQAGLLTPGQPYGGWERPDRELRGHFVGHYMSASALMWASTHNDTLYEKMTSVVNALSDCQNKIGNGYLSAFPFEFFDRVEAIQPVWAPYYTIHKIMAGLLDQYSLAGNSRALQMAVWMAEYFRGRVKNVIQKYTIERHWSSLNEESGGMNDVLYRMYTITGDQKHLILAHLFDKPCFLGLLALQTDSLSGFHANTHIPVVVGAQMRYEITGDPLYKGIATFFMDVVNSSHAYATGGTSVGELWSDPKRLASDLSTEAEESCTTYNMLKVSRNLFRWTKEMAYADYYERALTNGVLSIQRGREPGVMIYMLPKGPGQSKAKGYHGWGTQFNDFWCCYGTGIESFSKLGDSIYFEEMGISPGLYIVQFISSSFNWTSGGITLHQKAEPLKSLDSHIHVSLTLLSHESTTKSSTLKIRIPFWASLDGGKATINDQDLSLSPPGNILSLTKTWASNDSLILQLPINFRTEPIKDERPEYASIQAVFFGPYLLAGLTGKDWDINASNSTSIADWLTPVPASSRSQLVSLSQRSVDPNLFVSTSDFSLTMVPQPKSGTNEAVHATFRLIQPDPAASEGYEPFVMLEPLDLPGMVITHQEANSTLKVSAPSEGANCIFKLVAGLDGGQDSVSLEARDWQGCFIHSDGKDVTLRCQSESGAGFEERASFVKGQARREYHPVSFVAKGKRRNFLLEPLLSLRDESYTVYFNISGA